MRSYKLVGDLTYEVSQVMYEKYKLPEELLIKKAVLLSDTDGNLYLNVTYEFDGGISDITQKIVDSVNETIRLIVEFLSSVYKNYKKAKAKMLKK